jgi:hypothetical protein
MEPYQLSIRYIISGLSLNENSPEGLTHQGRGGGGRRIRRRNVDITLTPEFIYLPERVFCWVQVKQRLVVSFGGC